MMRFRRFVSALLLAVSCLFVLPPQVPMGIEKAAAADQWLNDPVFDALLTNLLNNRRDQLIAAGYTAEAAYSALVLFATMEWLMINDYMGVATQMFGSMTENELGIAAEAGWGMAW